MTIGERIVKKRLDTTTTQAQLAERLKVSQETVTAIEIGARRPSPKLRDAIDRWLATKHMATVPSPRGPRGSYQRK